MPKLAFGSAAATAAGEEARYAVWVVPICVVIIAAAVAVGSLWALRHEPPKTHDVHDLVHSRFQLTTIEKLDLQNLESRYVRERDDLGISIRAANWRLLQAIKHEGGTSPAAFSAMNAAEDSAAHLQRITIEHFIAMRRALPSVRRTEFDEVLLETLVRPS